MVQGASADTGTLVASGTTAVTNGGVAGYRVTSTTLTNTARAIYRLQTDVADFSVGAGQYWVTWALAGTGASGPFVPPVSDGRTGNAAQNSGLGYVQLTDGGSGVTVELPFAINGTVSAVPEATSAAMLLAGGVLVLGVARRRRSPR